MSFRTALAANFNIDFLWNQRPGIGGVAASRSLSVSQRLRDSSGFANHRKILMFLGDESDGKAACGA